MSKRLRPLEKTNLVKYLPPTVYTSILQPNYWLNDETIDYAQGLLSTQSPNIEGYQATVALAGSSLGGYIPTATDKFVQIVHINGNHWRTISNGLSTNPDTFQWYDSLVNPRNLPQFPQKVAAAMLFSSVERLVVDVMDIQQQKGGSDCELFAIANATALCHGTDPSCIVWKQSEMRKHLHYCITQGQLDLFPRDIIVHSKEGRINFSTIYLYTVTADNQTQMRP